MIKSSFFRQQALENYQQSQIPRVMPKFTSPLIVFLYWMLFFTCTTASIAVWSYNTPYFEQGTGIIRHIAAKSLSSYGLSGKGQKAQTIAILLLPDRLRTQLHTGDQMQLQVEGTNHPILGTIERIDETLLTPDEARQRYSLSAQAVANIPPATFVALIVFDADVVNAGDDGRKVTTHIQIGTQNVLSLFSQLGLP